MVRANSRLILSILLSYAALSFYEPFWRLTIRAPMEGRHFLWDYGGISGSGASGGYWLIALITVLGLAVLFLGWRGANRVFRWLILIWAALLFFSSLVIVVSDPGVKIIAETLNLELPYALVILPFDVLFFALTLYWVIKNRNINMKQDMPRWNRKNHIYLVIAIVLLPFEYVFFNLGEQHGMYDQVAVSLTFLQYAALNVSLFPWKLQKKMEVE